jgi:acid stress-induced BolA-like protein IbaG/YrbA
MTRREDLAYMGFFVVDLDGLTTHQVVVERPDAFINLGELCMTEEEIVSFIKRYLVKDESEIRGNNTWFFICLMAAFRTKNSTTEQQKKHRLLVELYFSKTKKEAEDLVEKSAKNWLNAVEEVVEKALKGEIE